jgi:hypothetical protein
VAIVAAAAREGGHSALYRHLRPTGPQLD